MNIPSSDHRKGCQCHTCETIRTELQALSARSLSPDMFADLPPLCPRCGRDMTGSTVVHEYGDIARPETWVTRHEVCPSLAPPHADAAQGGVTTNPDGSIAYRHVPIVEEKQK